MPHLRKLILSVDGGGIRGLIAVRVLQALQSRLRQRGLDDQPCNIFDLMCGTSTGGIIAAGLTAPSADGTPGKAAATLEELRALLEDESLDIFRRTWAMRVRRFIVSRTGLFDDTYDARPLEKRLQALLGWASLRSALTGVALTAYDLENRRPVIMTNGRGAAGGPADEYLFWQAARATSATPTFFEPALVENLTTAEHQFLIDGGVFAQDPVFVAVVEGMKLGWRSEEMFVLSIGTGSAALQPIAHERAADWGAVNWINPAGGSPLLSVVFDGQAAAAAHQADRLLNRDGETRFVRVTGALPAKSVRIDDARPGNIRRLNETADRIIRDNARALDFVAETICDVRQGTLTR